MNDKKFQRLLKIVIIASVFLFAGRAWQHLFWDAPFRALLWDESWMKGIVETLLKTNWEDYITDNKFDYKIQAAIRGFGWFYLICALLVLLALRLKKISEVFMFLGSLSLILLAGLYCKERFFSVGQFFEYSIQFSTPLILLMMVRNQRITPKMIYFLKIIIALTFICHGLYAVNYYPRPGRFMDMTINILGISESSAEYFLTIVGYLDFVIGIGVFLSFRYSKYILIYAIIWGFLTTFARIWANVYFEYFLETLHQWWYEAAYRVPHFLIPLVLYLILKDKPNLKRKANY